MNIVEAIKNEAVKQGMSLAKIARNLGMTPQNFNNILKVDSIKFSLVQKIAEVLNVRIGYLLNEADLLTENSGSSESSIQFSELTAMLKNKDEQMDKLLVMLEREQSTVAELTKALKGANIRAEKYNGYTVSKLKDVG